jgi:hypothetical protein
MKVNAYLPDDLGKRAKEADIPFSQLLRDAVVDELERRETVSQTLADAQVIELELTDRDGNAYVGRFTGTLIDGDNNYREIYLTDDERVIFYDSDKGDYWIVEDPETELEGWPNALNALGIKPTIDI